MGLLDILVAINNYHKLSGLTHHKFVSYTLEHFSDLKWVLWA